MHRWSEQKHESAEKQNVSKVSVTDLWVWLAGDNFVQLMQILQPHVFFTVDANNW